MSLGGVGVLSCIGSNCECPSEQTKEQVGERASELVGERTAFLAHKLIGGDKITRLIELSLHLGAVVAVAEFE